MDFSFTIRVELGGTVVRVNGDLDVLTAPRLREQFAGLVRRGHYDLIVDLENVSFLDSTGLGVLVHALKRTRAHDGSLRLVCRDDRILQIFRITGLTRTFPMHSTTAEALAAGEARDVPAGIWVTPPEPLSPSRPGRDGRHAER